MILIRWTAPAAPNCRPRKTGSWSVHSVLFYALFVPALLLCLVHRSARAQDDYEIQVYGSDTVKPGYTMFELHSNYTIRGSRTIEDGVRPTQDQFHETLEITRGINDWFETGFYLFTAADHNDGWQWVGDHIRPRVRAPESWKWPVGASLSLEFGYQERAYST